MPSAQASTPAATGPCIDPDETNAYRQRMGKWRRDCHYSVNLNLFWMTLHIARAAHQPLSHMLHFLEANPSQEELISSGSLAYQLITGKAESIFNEFVAILREFDFISSLRQCGGGGAVSADHAPELIELSMLQELVVRMSVHVILLCACEYHQRIIVQLRWS